MLGSLEFVRWNACVHRLDLCLYSHPKEFFGGVGRGREGRGGRPMESEPIVTPREKSPLPEKKCPQRRIEPPTLHQAGQRAQHITNELFRPRDLGLNPAFPVRLLPGRVIPVTFTLVLQWQPCQALGVSGSALALVSPVSVYGDWVSSKFDLQGVSVALYREVLTRMVYLKHDI